MAIEFKVSKVETATCFCHQCGGVGYTIKSTVHGKFKNPCTHCIEGHYTYEKRTEVTITEALKELGLII